MVLPIISHSLDAIIKGATGLNFIKILEFKAPDNEYATGVIKNHIEVMIGRLFSTS